MKAFKKLGFDIGYLALLTREHVKPLSRWEGTFSRGQIKALKHLGLKTDTVDRKLLNGGTTAELIFSTSPRYLDLYRRRYHRTPITKDRQTVKTEGFLFGYPGCCVRNFAENGYTDNEFVGRGQEILFHWACPGCRATPQLLPYYRQTHQECQQLLAAHRNSLPQVLTKSVPTAAFSLLLAMAPLRATAYDDHWLPLGPADPDGDYLTYSEGILLGTHLGFQVGAVPNGPAEATGFSAIINSLPESPSPTCCYLEHHLTYGVEDCCICGQTLNMGYVSVHNPLRGLSIDIPYVGLHYLEHGCFSYDGTVNSGRVDIKLLKEVLAPYDVDHLSMIASGDADQDGLRDEHEDYFGTQVGIADSDVDGLDDGAGVAEGLIEAISRLPVVRPSEKLPRKTPYLEYLEMDGVEICDICGMAINMGSLRMVNPTKRTEMSFPIVALHFMAHGRFSYGADWITGEVSARQLAAMFQDFTRVTRQEHQSEDITFGLSNHPNPFNQTTEIRFSILQPGSSSLSIYNINGQLVRILLNEHLAAGQYRIPWDGRSEGGQRVASGIYFCRLEHGGTVKAAKMMLLK